MRKSEGEGEGEGEGVGKGEFYEEARWDFGY